MSKAKRLEASAGGTGPYENMRTRRHWKREEAARVLSDWAESGLPMAAFARRHGLSQQRICWWRERLKTASSAGTKTTTRLVPATVRRAPLISMEPLPRVAAVVVATSSVRVEIADPHATDPQWVAALVRAVHEART